MVGIVRTFTLHRQKVLTSEIPVNKEARKLETSLWRSWTHEELEVEGR